MAEKKANNLSESLEDYLEAIWNLSAGEGHAHCTEIAEELDVAKPSVTGALRILKDKGLVNYRPYGNVSLTKTGSEAAKKIVRRHNVIESFFEDVLGVEDKAAGEAACRAEHALGQEVISRLSSFSEFINRRSKSGKELIRKFHKSINNGNSSKGNQTV